MSALSGFVGGVLGLSMLEALLASNQASGRLGEAFTGVAGVIAHLASPSVPAIPDLRTGSAATSSAYVTPAPSSSGVTRNRFPSTV